MLHVEVCVTEVEGVRTAREAGADRVELCVGLDVGGLTPSLALVEHAVAAAGGMGVHVLLRPRPGDFVHDDDELRLVLRDAEHAIAAGASGIVVGPLLPDGRLDVGALRRLRDVAAGVELTAHRGVDVHADVEGAVEALVQIGADRILTSGGASSAHDGADRIARAVTAAGGRITVMAGGGIRPDLVDDLVARTGIADVHLSASVLLAEDAGFGARRRTDAEVLRRVVRR